MRSFIGAVGKKAVIVWGILSEMKNHEKRMKSYETPTAFHGKSLFWVFVSVAENLGEKLQQLGSGISTHGKGGQMELPGEYLLR